MPDQQFPGPTWKSSHVYGQGFVNRARKLAYYNTPKCASMWMRKYLSYLGNCSDDVWESHNFTKADCLDFTTIIIVRDPIQRWLSICPMIDELPARLIKPGPASIFDKFHVLLRDEHTAPQLDFVNGIDLSNAVYFWCDHTLSEKMKKFLDGKGFDSVEPPSPINEQPTTENFKTSVDLWENLLQVPQWLNVFKKAYAKDYDLISRVQFYK